MGAAFVVNAFFPLRREPLTIPSFFAGWLTGELPLQHVAWQVVATVLFACFGALAQWPGRVGLVVVLLSWAGLLRLAVLGERSASVIEEAFAGARNLPEDLVAAEPPLAGSEARWNTWPRLALAVPLRGKEIERIKDIDYWGDGIFRHRLDVIRRRSDPPVGAPVLVYVHGGAWLVGEKKQQGNPLINELAARGWVCVSINYRLSPRSAWPDHIVDCKRAVAWVRANIAQYGGDPGFIAVSGGSAGGHLSSLLALTAGDPRWQPGFEEADASVDACLPYYGVYDLTGEYTGGGYGPGLVKMLEKMIVKKKLADDYAVFAEGSPTLRVHAGAPPFFVVHGTNDTLVPVQVARRFVEALGEVTAAPLYYAELPRAQHGFDILASLRCRAVTLGAVRFLEMVRKAPPHGD